MRPPRLQRWPAALGGLLIALSGVPALAQDGLGPSTTSAGAAAAQVRPQPRPSQPRPSPARADGVRARAFVLAGIRTFTASETFSAVLGSSSGPVFGGGGEVLWGRHLGVGVDVSRYRATGSRVFVSNGQVFPLGISTDVQIVPVAVSATYRFPQARSALIPFAGGGLSWHRYRETSEFAAAGEDVASTFTGFHLQGGVEWRASALVGVAGTGRWMTVPDALGTEATSAARAFGENDLGGFEAAVRVIVGRR